MKIFITFKTSSSSTCSSETKQTMLSRIFKLSTKPIKINFCMQALDLLIPLFLQDFRTSMTWWLFPSKFLFPLWLEMSAITIKILLFTPLLLFQTQSSNSQATWKLIGDSFKKLGKAYKSSKLKHFKFVSISLQTKSINGYLPLHLSPDMTTLFNPTAKLTMNFVASLSFYKNLRHC